MSGTCVCPDPFVPDGTSCVDPTVDPRNCGSVGNQCADDEYCVDGGCVCRPGLTDVGGGCVDLMTDPSHCGAPGNDCGGDVCADGTCVADCPGGTQQCGSACVDTRTDPLHCGGCGDACNVDEICADGGCDEFRPGLGCTMCPCDTSCRGDFSQCCDYPVTGDIICVDGDCP